MYDSMIYKKLPHGIEVLFINILDDKEEIYEDFFVDLDIDSIAKVYLKNSNSI